MKEDYTPCIQSYLADLVYLLRVVMEPLSGFHFLSLYQMTFLTLELFLDHWNQQYRWLHDTPQSIYPKGPVVLLVRQGPKSSTYITYDEKLLELNKKKIKVIAWVLRFGGKLILDFLPYSDSMANSNQVEIEIHGGVIPIMSYVPLFWFVNYMLMITLWRAAAIVSALF